MAHEQRGDHRVGEAPSVAKLVSRMPSGVDCVLVTSDEAPIASMVAPADNIRDRRGGGRPVPPALEDAREQHHDERHERLNRCH